MVWRQSYQRLGEPSARCMRRPVPQKSGMKLVLATIIGLAIAALATTASAHVVEITTSIPAAKAADDADLKEALATAIDDAVKHAIRFTPTLNQLAADEASSSSEPLTDLQQHELISL